NKAYTDTIRDEYDRAREAHLGKRNDKRYVNIKEARKNHFNIQWENYSPTKPSFLGTKMFENYPLDDLFPYIDWTPFFHTWELRGSYPRILTDKIVGTEATKVFEDAQAMLKNVIDNKLLQANGVIGFWPANSICDDIELYTDESRTTVLATIHTLRQQAEQVKEKPYYTLSVFIVPKESGIA